MRNLLMVFGVAGAFASSATMARAAFSDDFNTAQASSVTNSNGSGSLSGTALVTSNFSRTLSATVVSNTDVGDARARTAVSNGVFTFSSDNEVTGFGGDAYSFSSPISLLTTPAFQFTLLSNDVLGTLSFTEYDTNGNTATASVPLPTVVAGTPLVLTVPATQVGANFNSASINKLTFSSGGTQGEDLSIDSIVAVPAAVPEPGSLGLLGLAAGAGLLIRRRRA